jgi:hypothetical protein
MADPVAGGRDDVASDPAAAAANAQARYRTHEAETYGQGSTIGDVMSLPTSASDSGDEPDAA